MEFVDPTPKQWEVIDAMQASRLVICDGSVRSGKSVGADIAWIDYCLHAPAGNLLMAGKTERTLKRNLIDPLIELLGSSRCRYVGGSGEVFIDRRRIYLVGANDERAEEKIRGLTLVGAYLDEVSTMPESFFVMVLSRLSIEGARLIGTTNPDSPTHWLKTKYIDRADELSMARFQFRIADNPHLAASYVEAIKREFTGLWRRRLIDGEWAIAAGAVYEDWDPERHVVPHAELPPIARLLCVGIDYGDTAPTRGVLLGVSLEGTPRLVVADEWSPQKGMTQGALSADLRRWLGSRSPEYIVVDPAAAGFRTQLKVDEMYNTAMADNAVVGGIRLVASLLAAGRLIVSDRCSNLIGEFPSYTWDAKATARGEDAPVKKDDHAMDSIRYAIATTHKLWWSLVPLTLPIDIEEAI